MDASSVRRCWIVTIGALVVLLGATPVAFASPSAKLVYIRSPGAEVCPGEAELRKAVAVRLGYDPFFPVAQKTVVAQVRRDANAKGFQGKVQIVGADGELRGEKTLSTKGDDCGELIGALALAVSIALDDLDEAQPTPPPPADPPPPAKKDADPLPPPPPVAIPPDTTPPVQPSRATPTRLEVAASLGPTLSLATAPDAAAGASLATSLRWNAFALRLDVRGELPSSRTLASGGRVATNILLATASACLRGRIPFVCAGPGGGVLFSETRGITHPASDQAPIVVAVARGGANVDLSSRLYLEPFLEIGANLVARSVVVDGVRVHEASRTWGSLALHFGGRF